VERRVPDRALTFNDEQQAAIDADGVVFVSAGAGTGKTRVLVERFARAVLERDVGPDEVLAITYTERAAAELAARIRARLAAAGRQDLERGLDGAWISTIHAFCRRLLRRHALVAGIDPGFEVLSGAEADLLRQEAYDDALERLVVESREVVDVVAAYGERRLRRLIDATHEKLRTAGRPLAFPAPAAADVTAEAETARREAVAVLALDGDGLRLGQTRQRAAMLVDLLGEKPPPDVLADLGLYRSAGKLAACAAYDDALSELERVAREAVYGVLLPDLDALLRAFAESYAARKRAGSWLDFDDLQLETRRLLETRDDVREAVQTRFREVLVDEFQDTNELQCALVDLVAGPGASLFFVGDEFQSIYRFRDADVSVFRRRRAAARDADAASAIALTTNYRSRPEVLAVVNHLFAAQFGGEYLPLESGGAFPELRAAEPAVEFLVTDAAVAREAGAQPREVEARAVSERIAALVESGRAAAGDVVLLFASTGDADLYERALARVGLTTASTTGRRYYEAQAVRDVLAYLRLLRNRYDDVALLEVLASPLVGVTNDTLVEVRGGAQRRPLFTALERELPASLPEGEARLLAAFRQRYERLVAVSARLSLPLLVGRVVTEHDYDLALLAREDGARRFANVRKLIELARDFEALRGPDLEAFVSNVEVRALAATPESDAPVSEEDEHAVRLMTVHAAKGLEFPVVVVADAGRGARGFDEDLVALPDGRIGLKVPGAGGRLVATSAWEEARAAEAAADTAERRRVSYVALTRAIDRLIVSGVVNEHTRESSPLGWMLDALDVSLGDGDREVEVPGGRIAVRFASLAELEPAEPAPPPPPEAAAEGGQLALFEALDEVAPLPPPSDPGVPPPLPALPAEPTLAPGRLSFSALHLLERCGLRFHAERVLGLPARDARPPERAEPGLSGAELGTIVHDLLETGGRGDRADEAATRLPHASEADRERVHELLARWDGSELAQLVATLVPVSELPFMLEIEGAVVVGRLDLVAVDGGTAHVVDFKTNRLEGRAPVELRDADYGLQEAVYALALLRQGHDRVEVHFAFLDAPAVVSAVYGAADAAALAERVAGTVRAALHGPYVPHPGDACFGCPALDLYCAGPALDAIHAAPDA
jgi:ATP-dependent exoDNAse (exonuclease V) beta subunit